MPVTVSVDAGFPQRLGRRYISTGSIAFDNSYAAAGEAVTPNMLGFETHIDQVSIVGGTKGYLIDWDAPNGKLMVRQPNYSRAVLNPTEAERDLSAVAADVTTFYPSKALYIVGFASFVSTILACDNTPPVMSVERRDADGSSNSVEVATLTYVDADPVGAIDGVYAGAGAVGGGAAVQTLPYQVPAGKTIVLKHKTQAADSGAAAGGAICHIWVADIDAGADGWATQDLSGLTAVEYIAFGY